jgi:hypothetical protein
VSQRAAGRGAQPDANPETEASQYYSKPTNPYLVPTLGGEALRLDDVRRVFRIQNLLGLWIRKLGSSRQNRRLMVSSLNEPICYNYKPPFFEIGDTQGTVIE